MMLILSKGQMHRVYYTICLKIPHIYSPKHLAAHLQAAVSSSTPCVALSLRIGPAYNAMGMHTTAQGITCGSPVLSALWLM